MADPRARQLQNGLWLDGELDSDGRREVAHSPFAAIGILESYRADRRRRFIASLGALHVVAKTLHAYLEYIARLGCALQAPAAIVNDLDQLTATRRD